VLELHDVGGWFQRHLRSIRRSRSLRGREPGPARRAEKVRREPRLALPDGQSRGATFAQDMGYRSESGGWLPGISVFKRDGGKILRVADTGLCPGDDFCSIWHMLDLLPEGPNGWRPKFKYG
jgi:predicted dithiol-disulfide oxidoreductase (DUF899 family)